MRDKSSEIRRLEAEGARILKRRQRHDARGRQLAEAEKGYQQAIERVILSTMRAAGLTRLPLSELLENIVVLGQAASVSGVGEGAPNNKNDLGGQHSQSGGSEPEADVDRGKYEAFVKLSSNTSTANRETLEKSGLRWNGRLGGWKGKVGDAANEVLRQRFGDRLSILPGPLASAEGGRDEKPTVAGPTTAPIDASSPQPADGSASLAEAADVFKMTPLPGPDVDGEAMAVFAVGDNVRLPSPSLPPRPGALPKSRFARRPHNNG
jgi:hypothetical protein